MKNDRPNNSELSEDLWKQVVADVDIRRGVAYESHLLFFHIYLAEHVKYRTAPFQREIFELTENENIKTVVIEAFRGSGKTTIMGTSYSIWSILGKQKKKFILVLAQTQQQARQYLASIKLELSSNQLLKKDLGPFEETNDEWRSVSIVLPKYGSRITVASVDQSIRGLKHGSYRPDLIICDDLEDLNSVRSRDNRNKLYDWVMGDVIPLGDINTRLMVIGTRLHNDSLIMRIRKGIEEGKIAGIARSYPFMDEEEISAWPGKFSSKEMIEAEKAKSGDVRAWRREYMLEIVGDIDQVVEPEWIHYYDEFPLTDNCYEFTMTGVDPAFGENNRSDFTAMVTARVYNIEGQRYIYILPNPVNERLKSPEMRDRIILLYNSAHLSKGVVAIEDVGGQKMIIQELEAKGITAIPFHPGGSDKRTRLAMTAGDIKAGFILFPRTGVEQLIEQIVNFGSEKHDDLADAFTTLILGMRGFFIPYIGFF